MNTKKSLKSGQWVKFLKYFAENGYKTYILFQSLACCHMPYWAMLNPRKFK